MPGPELITDPRDPRLQAYTVYTDRTLRDRPDLLPTGTPLFVAESAFVVERLVRHRMGFDSLLITPSRARALPGLVDGFPAPVLVADRSVMDAVAGFPVHRGVLALAHRPAPLSVDGILAGGGTVVVVESSVDQENLGAVFRTCAALGAAGVLVGPDSVDPLYRRVVRVSMGASALIPWSRLGPDGPEVLMRAGYTVAALSPAPGALSLEDFAASLPPDPPPGGTEPRVALLLGEEGAGLSPGWLEGSTLRVRIPISSAVDSLNLAAAAAIALYRLRVAGTVESTDPVHGP